MRLAETAKKHSSEAFYAMDDPGGGGLFGAGGADGELDERRRIRAKGRPMTAYCIHLITLSLEESSDCFGIAPDFDDPGLFDPVEVIIVRN